MGIAAATGAVGAAALPVVKAPMRSPQAAAAATAPGAALASLEHPITAPTAGDEGNRSLSTRGTGRGRRLGGTVAPNARRPTREANAAAKRRARQGGSPTTNDDTAPNDAPGKSGGKENRGKGGAGGRSEAPGHNKVRNRLRHGRGKRPGPTKINRPHKPKHAPAEGKGPATGPGGKDTASSPVHGSPHPILDDVGVLSPLLDGSKKREGERELGLG